MAQCKVCGTKLSFFGSCAKCEEDKKQEEQRKREAEQLVKEEEIRLQKEQERKREEDIKNLLITTETCLQGLKVVDRLGVIIAEGDCAFDVKLNKNKEELLKKLREDAYNLGGNSVIGMTFEIVTAASATLGATEFSRFKLIAYGTVAIVE